MAPLSKQDAGNSQDLVDIKEVRDGVVIVRDGSFRQVIMVGGVNFSLKSESEQTILTQGYQNFLNGIDFPLQVLIHSRKVNIDGYVATLAQRKEVEQSPLLKNQISEYIDFINGFVQKNAIMEKVFLVVVSYYAATAGVPGLKSAQGIFSSFGKKKPTTAKGAEKKPSEEDEKEFHEQLEQLKQRTTQVTNGLLGIGLEATVLNNEQLIELFYNFYNPEAVERKDVAIPKEE
jgi:type IV secretory pathway VirB4 component